jgi:hypothetical protein
MTVSAVEKGLLINLVVNTIAVLVLVSGEPNCAAGWSVSAARHSHPWHSGNPASGAGDTGRDQAGVGV